MLFLQAADITSSKVAARCIDQLSPRGSTAQAHVYCMQQRELAALHQQVSVKEVTAIAIMEVSAAGMAEKLHRMVRCISCCCMLLHASRQAAASPPLRGGAAHCCLNVCYS